MKSGEQGKVILYAFQFPPNLLAGRSLVVGKRIRPQLNHFRTLNPASSLLVNEAPLRLA